MKSSQNPTTKGSTSGIRSSLSHRGGMSSSSSSSSSTPAMDPSRRGGPAGFSTHARSNPASHPSTLWQDMDSGSGAWDNIPPIIRSSFRGLLTLLDDMVERTEYSNSRVGELEAMVAASKEEGIVLSQHVDALTRKHNAEVLMWQKKFQDLERFVVNVVVVSISLFVVSVQLKMTRPFTSRNALCSCHTVLFRINFFFLSSQHYEHKGRLRSREALPPPQSGSC